MMTDCDFCELCVSETAPVIMTAVYPTPSRVTPISLVR